MRVLNKEELRIVRGGGWVECMDGCITVAELLEDWGVLDRDSHANNRDCMEFCGG
ncbi:MAG: hypothetical protein ACYSTZ_10280 [Planctomycetota bacterium]|jgi:hypothetical protein